MTDISPQGTILWALCTLKALIPRDEFNREPEKEIDDLIGMIGRNELVITVRPGALEKT